MENKATTLEPEERKGRSAMTVAAANSLACQNESVAQSTNPDPIPILLSMAPSFSNT